MAIQGNSLLRIADILRYEPVDIAIGDHMGVLSFERGYFPVFQFLASDLVLKSTLHKNIKYERSFPVIPMFLMIVVTVCCMRSSRTTTPQSSPLGRNAFGR